MLSIALLAAALFAPARPSSCPAPANTGTYRFTALSKDSAVSTVGVIVLENVEGCLEASVVTDNTGPAIIDRLSTDAATLTGTVRISGRDAAFMLTFTEGGATGSIVDGRNQWTLVARRTSGGVRRATSACTRRKRDSHGDDSAAVCVPGR